MNNLILPAKPIKAAMYYMAKMDVRYYLNGVHINPKGYIEATNGHCAIRVKCEEAKQYESTIVRINGVIPAPSELIYINIDDAGSGYCYFEKAIGGYVESNGIRKTLGVLEIEGSFPDLDKIAKSIDPSPLINIGFNPEYIALAGKAQRALGSRFPVVKAVMSAKDKAIKLDFVNPSYEAYSLVVPAKYEG